MFKLPDAKNTGGLYSARNSGPGNKTASASPTANAAKESLVVNTKNPVVSKRTSNSSVDTAGPIRTKKESGRHSNLLTSRAKQIFERSNAIYDAIAEGRNQEAVSMIEGEEIAASKGAGSSGGVTPSKIVTMLLSINPQLSAYGPEIARGLGNALSNLGAVGTDGTIDRASFALLSSMFDKDNIDNIKSGAITQLGSSFGNISKTQFQQGARLLSKLAAGEGISISDLPRVSNVSRSSYPAQYQKDAEHMASMLGRFVAAGGNDFISIRDFKSLMGSLMSGQMKGVSQNKAFVRDVVGNAIAGKFAESLSIDGGRRQVFTHSGLAKMLDYFSNGNGGFNERYFKKQVARLLAAK